MLLNDNNNLIKKVTFFYDSKNTNMAGPPSSQSELSYEHTYSLARLWSNLPGIPSGPEDLLVFIPSINL